MFGTLLRRVREGERESLLVGELLKEKVEKERETMRQSSQKEVDLKLSCIEDGFQVAGDHIRKLIERSSFFILLSPYVFVFLK